METGEVTHATVSKALNDAMMSQVGKRVEMDTIDAALDGTAFFVARLLMSTAESSQEAFMMLSGVQYRTFGMMETIRDLIAEKIEEEENAKSDSEGSH